MRRQLAYTEKMTGMKSVNYITLCMKNCIQKLFHSEIFHAVGSKGIFCNFSFERFFLNDSFLKDYILKDFTFVEKNDSV